MDDPDFEINEQGLFVASRTYLLKRRSCCGNACTNCPYPIDAYPNGLEKPKCRNRDSTFSLDN